MEKNIVLIGTLDTKGEEFKFIKNIIENQGIGTIVIDVGVAGKPTFEADIKKEEVAKAQNATIEFLIEKGRGYAMDAMMKGATTILQKLIREGKVDGVISLGGSGGTSVATYAMQRIDIGIPKVMVSTVASGDTRPYVGVKDITMMYSIVDISGINSISSKILSNAANAIVGMVKGYAPKIKEQKPLIAATMFGVTTKAVTTAKEYIEDHGYEVLVFHATGTGGRAMENLIREGYIKGVLDLTTTEWCDEIVGGVLSAGPNRLEAAGEKGIPQVVATGALDMVNFGPIDTLPREFKNRNLYKHNSTVTLMRTNKDENINIGKAICEKLNMNNGNTVLMLPLKGNSAIDAKGQVFYGEEEDEVLFNTIRENIDKTKVELIEMNNNINDDEFALEAAKRLIKMLEK